jgi:hypothetical protein
VKKPKIKIIHVCVRLAPAAFLLYSGVNSCGKIAPATRSPPQLSGLRSDAAKGAHVHRRQADLVALEILPSPQLELFDSEKVKFFTGCFRIIPRAEQIELILVLCACSVDFLELD